MTVSLFDFARKRAREYVRLEVRKDVKTEARSVADMLVIILEKNLGGLTNETTLLSGGFTMADHLVRWDVKYSLSEEKIGGAETASSPIPLSEEAVKVLKKLNMAATVTCITQVQDKVSNVMVHGIPDNSNGRTVFDQLHEVLVKPIWGDEIFDKFLLEAELVSEKKLDQNEIERLLSELKDWTLETDSITKTYKFKEHPDAMQFVSTLSVISRQEGDQMNLMVDNDSVKVYLIGLKEKIFETASKVDEKLKALS